MTRSPLFQSKPVTTGLLVLLLLLSQCGWAQQKEAPPEWPDKIRGGRLAGVLAVQGTLHLGSLTVLDYAWYRDYPRSSFHFFNDSGEWLQLDKCGHAVAANYITRIGYLSYRWAGLPSGRSAWYGGLLSMGYMLNIEILDGFSRGWGFSVTDFAANTAGSLMFVGQQLAWNEQRFLLKYSYHPTSYASYRPDLLGKTGLQRMLKDYNGHSYWISANISSFLPKESRFPKWLNLAAGYGAEGMTGAFSNTSVSGGYADQTFRRVRKFYLSADIDLTRIPVRSPWARGLFQLIGFIKIPAPAIEFRSDGAVKFHAVYF